MVMVAESVHDRYLAHVGHRLQSILSVSAPDNRGALPVEDAGGVFGRLATGELHRPCVEDERVAAQFRDRDGERDPGAGGGFVEEDGHGTGSGQRSCGVPAHLQLPGEGKNLGLLFGIKVIVCQEMARCHMLVPFRRPLAASPDVAALSGLSSHPAWTDGPRPVLRVVKGGAYRAGPDGLAHQHPILFCLKAGSEPMNGRKQARNVSSSAA